MSENTHIEDCELCEIREDLEENGSGIDWDSVLWEIEQCEPQEDMDGCKVRSVYLGSCLGLYPSGKYYTPFANSNVAKCKHCGGKGSIENEDANVDLADACAGLATKVREFALETFGPAPSWPLRYRQTVRFLQEAELDWAETIDCPYCGGQGSEEAYVDSIFDEKLEEEAADHGGCITRGEGDPLDVYYVETLEDDEEEENEDNE